MAEEDNTLRGVDALALLKSGRGAWNEWARKNPGKEVDFTGMVFGPEHPNLDNLIFPGKAKFHEARFRVPAMFYKSKFLGEVNFSRAKFEQDVKFTAADFREKIYFDRNEVAHVADFLAATFRGEAVFYQTQFHSTAIFSGSNFLDEATFEYVKFDGVASLENIKFQAPVKFNGAHFCSSLNLSATRFTLVPDFRSTVMASHLSLHDVTVDQTSGYQADDEARYCRMKELAASALDHDREQYFFAHELKAARLRQNLLRRMPGYLYQWCSDFGRSILRPFLWLICVWLTSGAFYALPETECPLTLADIGDGLVKSTSIILPFLGASRTTLSDGFDGWLAALAFAEGALGLVFIFLIGLALRNRFRI